MLFSCDNSQISKAVEYVSEEMKRRKVRPAEVSKALLATEEIVRAMIRHAGSEEERMNVRVTSFFGRIGIRITCRGTAFDLSEVQSSLKSGEDPETDAVISDLVSRIMSHTLSLKNRNGINHASIQVAAARFRHLILTLGSLAAGLLAGILMREVLPAEVNTAISTNFFTPVSTMFLNALKMVVAPLVLFSIASSVAEFNDLRSLGRIAARILGGYNITSVIAIMVGAAVWYIFPIGDPVLKNAVTASADSIVTQAQNTSVSLIDTVVNIIPKDIINPFLSLDMLQIIFIAVMTGIAAGALSNKLQVFKAFLNECNMIFSKITAMIISVMPLAVFCNMAKLMQTMQLGQLASVLAWIPVIYIGQWIMLLIYGLIIWIAGRENPLTFYRKFYPVMLTGYTLGSSNATLPTSMEICGNRLGISRQVYSFSLPLGATINMDGTCITLMISALFMAKVYGVQVTLPMMVTLFVSIFVLSLGAPGVPGSALICISILLPQIGIPAEAISIVMGLYTLVGMMLACVNVTGDAVITLVTAKKEHKLDLDVFRSKDTAKGQKA